ncbi:hypothetical protein [Streptomyces sp. NPDC006551]|uniref:hypothetical protein n=1 Tax=Streptomyces sp. NPDC006551 TaxID=3157178 RepID=UPI0033BBFC21
MDEAQVRRRLREAADSHQPDRARMLARVERGLLTPPPRRTVSAPRRPRALWVSAVAVAAAVAGVLSLGGLAATTLHRDSGQVATMPAPHPPLRAVGSIDPGSNRWWAQNNVTLTAHTPLTELTVELRIARTAGVASTGHWRTRPAEDFTVSVHEEATHLVYTWVLKPGRTVPPGSHVFAGQYNHAEGARDSGTDTYTVTVVDAFREQRSVRGDFRHSQG